ncbi:hypothetical protein [Pedobacter sp. Hv1]|uniref:hypothetical protein n=1 Tax=Pedobacter sp. Hv1 TaxID=1740090 RepID=UPI0006D8A3F7|nr:hypothetical protein [Pedobacter sp. Hv1]KQC00455.1 hypothetical protein AQF98_13355 [Pedobacter sp. Hv1]
MIKVLKLRKAVIAIFLGIVALIAARIMYSNKLAGSDVVLGISGVLLIVGALLFLYPILFAKKVDREGAKVELKPIGEEPVNDEHVA